MSVLTRITTRAKQIYKKGKAGISWVAAIKRASAQVKGKASPKRKRARTVKRRRRVGGEVPAYRMFNSIVWQKVKDDKIPFVERGNSYYTNDKYNQLITWSFRDSRQAQSWLKRNKSGKIGAIVHNPKLLAAGLGKGPRASHTSYIKIPTVSGIGSVGRRKPARKKGKSLATRYKAELKAKLARALLAHEMADTVKATKKAQKQKVKYRKMLRAL